MKLSTIPSKDLDALSVEQVSRIVFGIPPTEDRPAIAALLLGGSPVVMDSRARAAAELYRKGLVPRVIPTGGVRHPDQGCVETEAEHLARLLRGLGVPDEAILLENEATTTRENMILGEAIIERIVRPRGVFSVYVVTSADHLRRSLALARLYLPRTARVLGRAAAGDGPGEWTQNPFWQGRVRRELGLIKFLVDHGEMEDIEL